MSIDTNFNDRRHLGRSYTTKTKAREEEKHTHTHSYTHKALLKDNIYTEGEGLTLPTNGKQMTPLAE